MSRENVEVVQALFDAFSRRDVETASRLVDTESEVRPGLVGGPEGVTYRGPAGLERWWADIDAAWADFHIEPEEVRDLDSEVLVLGRAVARGRASGIALDSPAGWVARVVDGKLRLFRSFNSHEEALEAVGLRE